MKSNLKTISFVCICFCIIISCKKNTDSVTTITQPIDYINLLQGLWKCNQTMVITSYFSNPDTITYDTLPIMDNNRQHIVTNYEKYSLDNKFYIFQDTLTDTISQGTYKLSGNYLTMNSTNNSTRIQNRTISYIDSNKLILYINVYDPGLGIIQKYIYTYYKK